MRSRTKRLFTNAPHGWPINSAPDGIEKPPELTWHDYLVMLLQIAAEIEHALMVQYLYAAYSLDDAKAPDGGDKIWWWRKSILAIAKEEMGHLLTVQNVLRLIGGPISLDRSDYPWDTPFYPFRFSLRPLSYESLCCYLYAEMPEKKDLPDLPEKYGQFKRDRYDEVVDMANKNATGGAAHGVHVIYDWIVKVIENEEWIPDHFFNDATYGLQASSDEWSKGHASAAEDPESHAGDTPDLPPSRRSARVIVNQLASRTDAVDALRGIALQGEGPEPALTDDPSHFDRFLEIFNEFRAIQLKDSTWTPARNIVPNPITVRDDAKTVRTHPDDLVVYIESNRTRNWARLFNLRYRILLTYLAHMYRLPLGANPQEPGVRAGTLHRIFAEMYNLKTLADILMQLPVMDDPKEKGLAGPPFEMPYTLTLPGSEADGWRLHRELLTSSRNLCCYLYGRVTPNRRSYLTTLRDLDARSLDWIDQILSGARS